MTTAHRRTITLRDVAVRYGGGLAGFGYAEQIGREDTSRTAPLNIKGCGTERQLPIKNQAEDAPPARLRALHGV